jgi:hypothetical protein
MRRASPFSGIGLKKRKGRRNGSEYRHASMLAYSVLTNS